METVNNGISYDAYYIRDSSTNEPIQYNKQVKCFHANQDADYLIFGYDMETGSPVNVIQGFDYTKFRAWKIVRDYNIGSPSTEITITNTSGDIYRYTWNTVGTDPKFDEVSTAVGVNVSISDTDLNDANEGEFTIISRGTNYFEVENSSGVAESDVAIGLGRFVLQAVPEEKYLTLQF